MGGQGDQSLKVLGRSLSDFEAFLFSKLKWAGSHFRAFPP
jgi:flagellar motor switch protein FliM